MVKLKHGVQIAAIEAASAQPVFEDTLAEEELVEATPFIEHKPKAEPISIFG